MAEACPQEQEGGDARPVGRACLPAALLRPLHQSCGGIGQQADGQCCEQEGKIVIADEGTARRQHHVLAMAGRGRVEGDEADQEQCDELERDE